MSFLIILLLTITTFHNHSGGLFEYYFICILVLLMLVPFPAKTTSATAHNAQHTGVSHNDTTRLSKTMVFPLELANLLSQAALVVNNARYPMVAVSTSAAQIPALSPYTTAVKKIKSARRHQRRNLCRSLSSIKKSLSTFQSAKRVAWM